MRTGGPAPPDRRRARRERTRRKWVSIALFLLPALVLYCLFVIAPIFQAIHYSGYKWNGLGSLDQFVGLRNFKTAFEDPVFTGALKHNGIIILLSLFVQLPFALACAWIRPVTCVATKMALATLLTCSPWSARTRSWK